ncbi:peptide/nickel transport system ATP-binding protein [Friedmanniella endophytica]|uniref:Peptide/nickel transport system ATP-binding protein n=1 Tax=Microlunatus kandeliicorticis TaxID=1759536 RepID=A0A7W3P444_9ACTN|nr:ABC transporter ATP-binding protein [Microlunatus kandeliicorticis]MBA8792507.1 peptide/nickel transport system ATP-binding protein [Microlunatus kandeliicorticis]
MTAPTPGPAPALAVHDLRIAFAREGADTRPGAVGDGGVTEVVHGVDFAVERGRVLALVGESGSGKSVTAMSVLGLLPGTARATGRIEIDGAEVLGAPEETLRALRGRAVGTVFQEPSSALNPVFTVGDQIVEAIWAHHPETTPAQRRQRVVELLEAVGVADPRRIARSYPHQASGGQLQRAVIAMAISNDPTLLIADEPTTALDVTVQAGILELLRDLTRRLDTAVLLITHDMGVVADVADEVAVMEQGSIVETAPTRQLFAAPRHAYTRSLLGAVPELGVRSRGPVPADEDAGTTTAAAELVDAVVTFRGSSGTTTAVDHVSLRIEPGEFVGLVGESGSGKSTIGRTLSGLVPLTSGRALLAGIDVGTARGSTLRRARSELGLVFQDPASSLNPRHTVGRSIADPLRLHTDLDQPARRARVLELLDAVRLAPALADRYPHELSGGQRQRVAIARALSCRPTLLIADEPTSALDVSVQQQILELLRRLQAELGFACLFISHDLAVVGELTTRVGVLRAGRLVEQGPTATVLGDPQDAYTRRLLAAVPVPDPERQAERRRRWRELAETS